MTLLRRLTHAFDVTRCFLLLFVFPSRKVDYGARFISSTEGDCFERSFAEFAATPSGPRLLEERPDTRAILSDMPRLSGCPAGSLGRLYFEFMHDYGLDEGFYQTDVLRSLVLNAADAEHAWYRNRMGNHHDLYHILSGYGPDALGEVALMTFRYGQTRHRGVLALCVLMMLRHILDPRAMACIIEAYRRGSRATKLEMLPWEQCLDLPLTTARMRLGVVPAKRCPHATAYAADAYAGPFAQPDLVGSEGIARQNLAVPSVAREAA